MIRSKHNDQRENRLLNILFATTFLIHLVWIAYASNAASVALIEDLQGILSITYSGVGFEWRGKGAYVVTAALASSVLANGIRRFFEGVFLGWPRFKEHDKNSLTTASMLFIGYGVMMYFAIGFFGQKYSSRPLNLINIGLVAVSTYIFGLLVDLFDDVVSGIYCIYRGGKA